MVITGIGQVGITTPTKRYVLTPSLAAMASIVDATDKYLDLLSPDTAHEWRVQIAHDILTACSDCPTIVNYLGIQKVGKPRLRNGVLTTRYNSVYVSDAHAIVIAETLLYHGMVGKVEHKAAPSGEVYTSKFDPLEWVSAVVAHLGLSERDAWGMTMTSVLNAMKTKFPPSEKEQARQKYTPESKAADDAWWESIHGPKQVQL